MRFLRPAFPIIRANLGAYALMNAIMYGLFLVGMAVALVFPRLTAEQGAALHENGTAELVISLLSNVWLFSLTIFAVNTLTVGVLGILLPSMLVPFAGIAYAAYKAFQLGLALAPVDEIAARIMIPHSLTVLIEFQAYVLVMFGAYVLGKAWLRPATVGAATRRQGYVRGLQQFGWVSVPALVLLVVGALYEAFEIIHLVPLVLRG